MSKLVAVVASLLFLPASIVHADETEYVAEMLSSLRSTMGIESTDPEYCAKSRDLCEVMCARFLEDGIVGGNCDQHCDAALANECPQE